MRTLAVFLATLVLGTGPVARAETALSALRALPKMDTRNLVRIEGHDGRGAPERWSFTVFDPSAPSHLREWVVVKGMVASSGEILEQDATLLPRDVWEGGMIRVDSDQAADLALAYAAANKMRSATLTYELRRQGPKAVPVWMITCLDQNNQPVGSVVLTATGGDVVASDGFTASPAQPVATAAAPVNPAPTAVAPQSVVSSDREYLESQSRKSADPVVEDRPAPVAARDEVYVPPVARSKAPTTRTPRSRRDYDPAAGAPYVPDREGFDYDDGTYAYVRRDRIDRDRVDRYGDDWDRDDEVRFHPSEEVHRKVSHIRQFIHRLLPF